MRNLFVGCAIVALAVSGAHAQETTSSIRGTVVSAGAPVANAMVTIVHVPSGTTSVVKTDATGTYVASGLRPGGPYTVSVKANGFGDYSVTDVNTVVAQAFEVPIELQAQSAAATPEIVVTASKVRGARSVSFGPATVLTADKISQVASVNRDIRDLMRRDPFATLDTSSTTGRNVSFAGQNPRFNRFTIDGVPITDSFGLNPDALPSRRGPVPLDSIAQFETKVAPYDIREGFFEGGVVNATLKSGTNEFHGTGFYSYNDNNLTGDRTKSFISNTSGKIPQPKFKSQDYGVTLSGPIIKDKLFFMISGERVRANNPYGFGPEDNNGGQPVTGLTQAELDRITTAAKNVYGVDAGGVLRTNGDKDDRLVGKLDANISDTQRLSLTGIYTKDSLKTLGSTFNDELSTESADYLKPDRVFAGVAQLNSDWSSKVSTEARVLYKDYKSGQTPLLADTAQAQICTDNTGTGTSPTSCAPNSTVDVGPNGSAQANKLRVKTFEASLVTRFTFGDHHVRLLTDFQNSKNYDLFVNGPNGIYYFDSITDFENRQASKFSLQNATSLNPNDAAANFTYQTYTLGLQDDWKIGSNLSVSYGLRYDLYGGHSEPALNNNFLAREGFANTDFINGKGLLQPRVGFDYSPTHRLNFHGGGGIFGGGTPDVYVGNSFSNSGVQPAVISNLLPSQVSPNQASEIFNNVDLTHVPDAANALLTSGVANNGTTSALARNFKIPSQWRMTLSASYDANLGPLGDHWIFGVDGFYSKVRNAIFVQDIRNRAITGASALTPDGRQRYYDIVSTIPGNTGCFFNSTVCSDTNGDYQLGNTSHGRSYVGVVHFDKKWDMGLEINGSFTYQNVKDQEALTSSIASSNYNNGAFNDPNGGAFGHSNDEVKYSFKYDVSYEHAFFEDYKTRFDIFGETRIGSPYSYTFQDISSGRSTVFGTAGTNSHYLFYVPNGPNDPLVTYDSPASRDAIQAIINSSGLKKYAGKVAPRNGFNSKWFTKLDLHVEQEIPTFVGRSRITVFADIENFLNLIDHNMGQQLRSFFPYNKTVAQVSCVAVGGNACAQYRYSAPSSASKLADQLVTANGSSLYSIRIGARLSF